MATEAMRAIEAILMVSDTPVEPGVLAQLLEVTPGRVEEMCAELSRAYDDGDRGFVLVRVAGGYRFQSHPDLAPYVERFVLDGQTARLSAAALETLAIVTYKQPVSRAQISAIRGVNADGVLRTLEQRGYIAEVARDPGPGQAVLYGTTGVLLERLGLDTLADLPALADFVPGPEIMEVLEHSLRFERERRDGSLGDGGGGGPSTGTAGDEARTRLEAENTPDTDESGIDDFRGDDVDAADFDAADFDAADFDADDFDAEEPDAGDDHGSDDHDADRSGW